MESSVAMDPAVVPLEEELSFDIGKLHEEAKTAISTYLARHRGRKWLVMEKEVSILINRILRGDPDFLLINHVIQCSIFPSDQIDASALHQADHIVLICRPAPAISRVAAGVLSGLLKGTQNFSLHLAFTPCRSIVAEQMLEDESILDRVHIAELPIYFIPFDTDFLSIEVESLFNESCADSDPSSLTYAAKALVQLQRIYGRIPHIRGKGSMARRVLQQSMNLWGSGDDGQQQQQEEKYAGKATAMGSVKRSIEALVIIDRDVDLVSPLVSPLTYEGLMDHFMGIDGGEVHVPAALLDDDNSTTLTTITTFTSMPSAVDITGSALASSSTTEKVTVVLSDADKVFSQIRDTSIERLGSFLQGKAIEIKGSYDSFRDHKDASLSEIHGFVKKLPALAKDYKSLNMHINIAAMLKRATDAALFRDVWQWQRAMLEGDGVGDQLEDFIAADVSATRVYDSLGLICLLSQTTGGIRPARLENLRRLVAQTYGLQHVFTLFQLEKSGIIKRKEALLVEGASAWSLVRKTLQLIHDPIAGSPPQYEDISSVSAGYAPLSVRLIQALGLSSSNSWSVISEVMKLLPGSLIELTQSGRAEELHEALARAEAIGESSIGAASAHSAAAMASAMAAAAVGGAQFLLSAPSNVANTSAAGVNFFFPEGSPRYVKRDSRLLHSSISPATAGALPTHGIIEPKPYMIVFYIGGVSYIEIAALRALSKDPQYPFNIIIATTKIISGAKLLNTFTLS